MATFFESPTTAPVLGLLSGAKAGGVTASEATRRLHTNLDSTQRALHRLKSAGPVIARRHGKELFFSLDRDGPSFHSVRSLGLQMGSLGADLARAQRELGADAIQAAFIFGSFANGTDTDNSDLDLFVIGDVSLHQLVPYIWDWTDRWAREVNPIVKSAEKVSRALADERGFARSVLEGRKIFLLGSAGLLKSLLGRDFPQ